MNQCIFEHLSNEEACQNFNLVKNLIKVSKYFNRDYNYFYKSLVDTIELRKMKFEITSGKNYVGIDSTYKNDRILYIFIKGSLVSISHTNLKLNTIEKIFYNTNGKIEYISARNEKGVETFLKI